MSAPAQAALARVSGCCLTVSQVPGRGLCYLRCLGLLLQATSPYIQLQTIFLTAQARLQAVSRRLKFVISSIISVFTATV